MTRGMRCEWRFLVGVVEVQRKKCLKSFLVRERSVKEKAIGKRSQGYEVESENECIKKI